LWALLGLRIQVCPAKCPQNLTKNASKIKHLTKLDRFMARLKVSEFALKYQESLSLELFAGKEGLKRFIKVPEVERPGISLAGFLKNCSKKRILVFGRVEMDYLSALSNQERKERLAAIFSKDLPMIVVGRRLRPFKEMIELCNREHIPLFRTKLTTIEIMGKLTVVLGEEFAPTISCHGTLVECFGIGVLLQGDSSVGKSETALGLIERGHRLISDDVVIVRKIEGRALVGSGPELTRHMLEIRGIGIINVAHIYGAVCISERCRIDLAVKLEEWDQSHFYDRVGLEEKYIEFLGVKVPHNVLPVKPGRDVVLLLETVVLNHRLKQMGYNSAREFNTKLLETISLRQRTVYRKKSLVQN
jgi:HPr kinase/phosphorylase